MVQWDGIEAFIEVVRLGTFAAAARQLNVSNSHVSRQVAQLEQQLGLPLLYRTTRQIHLTDAGIQACAWQTAQIIRETAKTLE